MRKIKWVNSYRDIPNYKKLGLSGELKGYQDPRTDTIYLIRGKASRATQEHEIAHSKKRDPDKPRNPKAFVMNEIRAYLISYQKIRQPVHIKGILRGIYWELRKVYKLTGPQAISTISAVMRNKVIPLSWKSDWLEIRKSG